MSNVSYSSFSALNSLTISCIILYKKSLPRQWMIILAKSQNFVTGRMQPKLVKISTSVQEEGLLLQAASMEDLVLRKGEVEGSQVETK